MAVKRNNRSPDELTIMLVQVKGGSARVTKEEIARLRRATTGLQVLGMWLRSLLRPCGLKGRWIDRPHQVRWLRNTMFDESAYRAFFRQLTGTILTSIRSRLPSNSWEGRSVVLRAPTGAGKTWSVLVPFFYPDWQRRPARLIYALPLRTLAQGIYREARETARRLGSAHRGAGGRTWSREGVAVCHAADWRTAG